MLRDKACVEATIGVIQRSLFQELREVVFYDIRPINDRCLDYLIKLNSTEMKDYGVNRSERFSIESPLLQPIAGLDFEIAEWKAVKGHRDSCI